MPFDNQNHEDLASFIHSLEDLATARLRRRDVTAIARTLSEVDPKVLPPAQFRALYAVVSRVLSLLLAGEAELRRALEDLLALNEVLGRKVKEADDALAAARAREARRVQMAARVGVDGTGPRGSSAASLGPVEIMERYAALDRAARCIQRIWRGGAGRDHVKAILSSVLGFVDVVNQRVRMKRDEERRIEAAVTEADGPQAFFALQSVVSDTSLVSRGSPRRLTTAPADASHANLLAPHPPTVQSTINLIPPSPYANQASRPSPSPRRPSNMALTPGTYRARVIMHGDPIQNFEQTLRGGVQGLTEKRTTEEIFESLRRERGGSPRDELAEELLRVIRTYR